MKSAMTRALDSLESLGTERRSVVMPYLSVSTLRPFSKAGVSATQVFMMPG